MEICTSLLIIVARVTRVDPNSQTQAKQGIKFNESNHDTKTDNLKSCVTLGDHCSHPNGIEV